MKIPKVGDYLSYPYESPFITYYIVTSLNLTKKHINCVVVYESTGSTKSRIGERTFFYFEDAYTISIEYKIKQDIKEWVDND